MTKSTSYVLLDTTKIIMKVPDDGNFAYGIFVNLQETFDTLNILIWEYNLIINNNNQKLCIF